MIGMLAGFPLILPIFIKTNLNSLKDSCPQTVTQIGKREELMYNPIKVRPLNLNLLNIYK